MTYYFDMDGVLADFHGAYATDKETAKSREKMATLEPFMQAITTVKNLLASGAEIFINSLAANDDGKAGKIEWLKKYLPEIDEAHIIIIVGYGKKASYANKPGILVDDKLSNCKQWTKLTGWEAIWVEERGYVAL